MSERQEQHKIVVGLGNPGKPYLFTRHNIGFLVAEAIAHAKGWSFKEEKKFNALAVKGATEHGMLHILKPVTYMNESGRAVRAYLDYYKLGPQDLIIVADDVALPFGHSRVRTMGGTGGHNGLRSLESHLQTTHYARVRMGVDKKPPLMTLADYVLSSFSSEELNELPAFVERGVHIVKRLIAEEITTVMNTVNTRVESKIADLEKRSGE